MQSDEQLHGALASYELSDAVASHYIDKPLLLDGLKFDLRIYALVTSCEPLRIFLFKQGLVRCCTQAYQHPEVSPATMVAPAEHFLMSHLQSPSQPFEKGLRAAAASAIP